MTTCSPSRLRSKARNSTSFKLAMYKNLSNIINHTGWLVTLCDGGSSCYFTIDFNPEGSAFDALFGFCREKIHVFEYRGEQGLSQMKIEKPLVDIARWVDPSSYEGQVEDVLDAILEVETSSYHFVWNNCRDFVDFTMKRVTSLPVPTNRRVQEECDGNLYLTRVEDVAKVAAGAVVLGGVLALGSQIFRTATRDDRADRKK